MVTKAFYPWTSDESPKPPRDWGLGGFRGIITAICSGCIKPLKLREEYLYSLTPLGVLYCHNTVECVVAMNERFNGNAEHKESNKAKRADLPEEKGREVSTD